MLVTRHKRFTGEIQSVDLDRLEHSSAFFVDWVSMHQTHEEDLPIVNDGTVMGTDQDGELVWKTTRHAPLEGSYDTSLRVRCDGHTVAFSGNVSRFCRTDNLFGYSFKQCLTRINAVLGLQGLPPFTPGKFFRRTVKTKQGIELVPAWTGAHVTRLDLTANYETGSLANARAYLEWLSTQQGGSRIKVGTHGDGETVDWNRGSRRVYSKVYLKSAELRKHDGLDKHINHCEDVGLVRLEITVKATQLHSMGCNYLGGLDMKQLELLFDDRRKVMTRAEHTHDDLEHLPNHFRRTARDYLAGDDLIARMSKPTFWRHRQALLPYGIDIAVKRNVIDFKPRVRTIEVRPASVPSWYDFNERKFA